MSTDPELTFAEYRSHLWGALQSSHEHFDKAILSLSSGGLALSLSFVANMGGARPKLEWVLIVSWCLFSAAILSNVLSLLVSQKAIGRQIEYAKNYYIDGQDEFLAKQNAFSLWTKRLNYGSGALFVCAVAATVLFASVNIATRREAMSTNKPADAGRGYVPPKFEETPRPLHESGYVPPSMPEAPQKPSQPPPAPKK
jgi:hypothetical protein